VCHPRCVYETRKLYVVKHNCVTIDVFSDCNGQLHVSACIGHLLVVLGELNPLTPNDPYRGRTAPLASKHCILYIYSTNIGTEYFKHGTNSQFLSLQNAICFIILTYFVPVLFTFYIQDVLKLKSKIPSPNG